MAKVAAVAKQSLRVADVAVESWGQSCTRAPPEVPVSEAQVKSETPPMRIFLQGDCNPSPEENVLLCRERSPRETSKLEHLLSGRSSIMQSDLER